MISQAEATRKSSSKGSRGDGAAFEYSLRLWKNQMCGNVLIMIIIMKVHLNIRTSSDKAEERLSDRRRRLPLPGCLFLAR